MTERLFRYIQVDRSKIDRDAKTIPLSFSSESPAIQRSRGLSTEMRRAAGLGENELYVEILDHSPENVDLSMLNNRGAFLDEHDEKDQIGVVEKAEIADKQGRAVVQLSSHEKGVKRFGEMVDGHRPHISAGYSYTRFLGDETHNGRKAKRFAWKGLEISSVAVPADGSIGVARNFQDLPQVDSPAQTSVEDIAKNLTAEQKIRMKTLLLDPNPAAGGGGATVIDEAKVRAEEGEKTRGAERKRMSEISTIADALIKDHGSKNSGKLAEKIRGMANEAIQKGETVPDFQIRCMTDVLSAKPAVPVLLEDCTNENDGQPRYSLLRGIQSCLNRKSTTPDGREGEVHQEMIKRAAQFGGMGYEYEGFQVPHNVRVFVPEDSRRRDMQATIFPSGGAFVPTTLTLPIIELLKNMTVLDKAGIRTMAGLQGNIVIPRQEAAATAYSVSEIQALTDSQQILGQIALSPKRVGATETYSKQFVMQSSPDVEAFMQADLFSQIALKWDSLGLNGQGAASEPLGIMNTPGIATVLFGATPTYIKLISMRTAIRKANVTDPLTLVSTPGVEGSLSGVAEALTGATTVGGAQNAIWKPDGRVIGVPAISSNQIPNDLVVLGAFSHLIRAIWGGLDVVVDQFTKAKNAETVISINTWGDYAVRHPQAFCVSADSGAQ